MASGDRAVSHLVGVVLLVGITVVLMVTIGSFVFALGNDAGTETPKFELDCNTDRDAIRHGGGDEVDGERLTLKRPTYDIDDGPTFTAGDILVPSSASVDVTLDSAVVWDSPRGGSSLVECGP